MAIVVLYTYQTTTVNGHMYEPAMYTSIHTASTCVINNVCALASD